MEGFHKLGRVVFDDIDSSLKDDESFEQALYLDTHQIHHSMLIGNGIKCVTQFPLDYMHLVCFGVIKRFLLLWKKRSTTVVIISSSVSSCFRKIKRI